MEPPSMSSEVDRLSALPEDLLLHVLRSLPAQEVVRTCVLARRWRSVWRSVPVLRFIGVGANGWGSADRFADFVDHLLQLRCAAAGAPLDSCDFDLYDDGPMELPAHQQQGCKWILQVAPVVRDLRLRAVDFGQEPSPLASQHLTRLELIGVVVNNSVADFSSCPALVQLNMESCDVFVEQILSPSLKHLRIARCYLSEYDRVLISLPSLVSLELIKFREGRIPLLGGLPRLRRAVVIMNKKCSDYCWQYRFDGCGAEEDCQGCYYYHADSGYPQNVPRCDRNNSIFLKGLSEATELELSADSNVIVFNRDLKWCPTFTKLKTLLLNDWCLAADHNALICFLQHSPSLEKLIIQLSKEPPNVMETEGIYKPVGQSVASDCLKIVEIRCANVDERVQKILNILITHGIRHEQINIQLTSKIPGYGCFNFVCTGFS